MEVRIGVVDANRELSIDATESADDVRKSLEAALAGDSSVFELHDEHGRSVMVPVEKLAYVEMAGTSGRRVGFGLG